MFSPDEHLCEAKSMSPTKSSGENIWMTRIRYESAFARVRQQTASFANLRGAYHSCMPKKVTLHDLFPDMCDKQINEIAETLHGYCAVVWRIYERLERDHPEIIDDLMKTRSMKIKVDSSTNTN
jgi:hypothetical protein